MDPLQKIYDEVHAEREQLKAWQEAIEDRIRAQGAALAERPQYVLVPSWPLWILVALLVVMVILQITELLLLK